MAAARGSWRPLPHGLHLIQGVHGWAHQASRAIAGNFRPLHLSHLFDNIALRGMVLTQSGFFIQGVAEQVVPTLVLSVNSLRARLPYPHQCHCRLPHPIYCRLQHVRR